jgi:simple sugar transport system permease protein
MQLLGVHKSFPELIQGLALLFIAGRLIWERLLSPSRRRAMLTPEAPRA